MPLEAVLIHRVIARMNIGGPAMHVVHLTKGLSTGYFKTRLIAGEVEDTEGDMRYYAEERGVEIVHVRQMARSLRPWQDFRTFLTLYRMFRREKPWIVHTHTAKAGAVGRLAAWFARVPIRIHTYHGHVLGADYFSGSRTGMFLRVERMLAKITRRLVVLTASQADEMADDLHIAPRDKFAVIPLGLDLGRFARMDRQAARDKARQELGLTPTQPVIGTIGRLVPVKNHDLLLYAHALLCERMDPAPKLVVVGSGERSGELKRLSARLELSDHILWLGWRDRLEDILPAMDVLALTSHNEGTPVAVIEAMAADVPVVARAVGGVAEVLDSGRLGRLVWEAEPEAMADALQQIIEEGPEPASVEAARRYALDHFCVERLLHDVKGLYLDELGGGG
ncbi:MAG: glycosyltransferase [Gemmatimonadetes bacterium]|nr:glycosyltransferase [Gemmatimonadota bacterium]